MTFALCTDDNYAMPCRVCITSIFENHRDEACKVYVLTSGLNADARSRFTQLAEIYRQQIVVLEVDDDAFAQLKTRHRYRTSMYYRFLLPELVQEERVLYLDCDIVVRHNLSALEALSLEDKACAVVEDQRSDEVELHNRIRLEGDYFNSGVMLMNLDYWRRHQVKRRLLAYIEQYPERCFFPDQDALNAVLSDEIVWLPYTYNFQEQWYWEHSEQAISFRKWEAIAQYAEDPAIVHYTWNLKPWHEQCWHVHKEWFLHYAQLHSCIGFALQHKYQPRLISRVMAYAVRRCVDVIRYADKHFSHATAADILGFFSIK